jgi:4-amino-4-deoxy-L-arabinose transferase-like glycosyltransferase
MATMTATMARVSGALGVLPVLFAAALYLPCATYRAVNDVDEALYVRAAQEMLARRDWTTPTVNGVRFLDKPPLLYWVLAGLFAVLGPIEPAAHLPPALFVIATTWVLARMVGRSGGALAGFAAGLCFAFSAGAYLFTRDTLHDPLFVFFQVVALDGFLRWREGPARSTGPLVLFAVALAGGVLSKGLLGVLFPVAIAAGALVLDRERPRLPLARVALAGALFLVLAVPWHVAVARANPGFVAHYFLNEQILRFLDRREPMDFASIPLPRFLALLPVWIFPWTAFVPAAALLTRATGEEDPAVRRLAKVALVWFAVVLLFFSASSRLEHYAFPLLPPLAIVVGLALAAPHAAASERVQRAVTWGFRALAGVGTIGLALAVAGAAWLGTRDVPVTAASRAGGPAHAAETDFGPLSELSPDVLLRLRGPAALAVAALGVGLVTAWWLDARRRRTAAIIALAGAMMGFGAAADMSLRVCEDVVSSKRFGVALARSGPGDHVVVQGDYETANSMSFYQPLPIEVVDGGAPALASGLREASAFPMVLSRDALRALWAGDRRVCVLVGEDRLGALALPVPLPVTRAEGRVLACNRANRDGGR